jgi:hypothetical protein
MPDTGNAIEHVEHIAPVIESHVLHSRQRTSILDLLVSKRVVKTPRPPKGLERANGGDSHA